MLKDDKSYPYIELTDELYPTLKVVRNLNRKKNKSKNKYFGPYPNVTAARKTVDIINRVYPLRKCNHLGKELCLYYHIGECRGYCKMDNIDHEKLDVMKKEIISFLNGNKEIIAKRLKEDMAKASEQMNYEKALELKTMLDDISITLAKQRIDLNKNYNFDLFGYYNEKNYLSIQVFFIRDGILFGHHSDIFTYYGDVSESVIEYIIKYYEKGNLVPKEIIVNDDIDYSILTEYFNNHVMVPKKGDIKNLLNLANSNAKTVLEEKMTRLKHDDDIREEALNDLEKALGYRVHRIETFDNSHLFGTFYVSGMVVFDDFLPNKNLYRKFKISTEVKDDLAAMKEVLYRRYFRVLMEDIDKPDLIIVDGGELQVNVSKEIISSLGLNIHIIVLKKNDKHRTSSIIDENLNVIDIDSKSNLFLFLTRIQDEVHNYAINYHRNIKAKGMLSSVLDMVEGIGEVRKKDLLKKYGSLKKMKEASLEELETILSKQVALNLFNYLKNIES